MNTRLFILALTFVLALGVGIHPALAVDVLYVSPAGNDANNCLSWATACLTPQRAVQVTSIATSTNVMMAAGLYPGGVDVVYWRFVTFVGDCDAQTAVVIVAPRGGYAIAGEDHAILGARCLKVQGSALGTGIGVATRQYTIADVDRVTCEGFTGGLCFVAAEQSRINCTGALTLVGDAAVYFAASEHSYLSLQCPIALPVAASFAYFLSVDESSSVRVWSTFTGPGATGSTGGQYALQALSVLTLWGTVLPGQPALNYVSGGSVIR